jgi:hypothetical protein
MGSMSVEQKMQNFGDNEVGNDPRSLASNLSNPAPPPSAGGAAPVAVDAAPASVPECASLTPDTLMAYCESRLNSLDSQMDGIFTSQQKNAALTQDVNAIASSLNDLPPGTGTPPTISASAADVANIVSEYQAASTQAAQSGNQELATQLSTDATSLQTAAGTSDPASLSGDALSQLTQNLKNYSADLNSNSEMTMITLQSLMSQRQTAIQLTTNLVQSVGDQASSISKNIGQ